MTVERHAVKKNNSGFLRTSIDVIGRVCLIKKKMVQKGKAKGINFKFNGVITGFWLVKSEKCRLKKQNRI